jgi:hypothetical protein
VKQTSLIVQLKYEINRVAVQLTRGAWAPYCTAVLAQVLKILAGFKKRQVLSNILQPSVLLSFWTLPIVQYSKKIREHNVSETGSVAVLRSGRETTISQLGSLERANLNHWTTTAI